MLHDVRPSYPPLSAAKLHQCYLHSSTGNKDIFLAKKEVKEEAERCNEVFSSLTSAVSVWKDFTTFQMQILPRSSGIFRHFNAFNRREIREEQM
jgi:hypothetical protein